MTSQNQPTPAPAGKWRALFARHENLGPFILIVILSFLYFWPVLVGGKVLLGMDYLLYFHPGKTFYREALLSGDFPLWIPYPAGGVFFAANSGNAIFYPLTYLNLLFTPSYAFGAIVFCHMIIFTFFFYRIGRECGVSVWGSLFIAMGAFLSGTILGISESAEHGAGLAWYPAIIACFIRLLKSSSKKEILWLALVSTMQVLAGSPYPPFYSMISLIVIGITYAIVLRKSLRFIIGKIVAVLMATVLILFLSAPQLVPMLSLLKGVRQFGQEALFPKEFSMRPADWVGAVVPNAMGGDENFKCFYFGSLILLMILAFLAIMIMGRTKEENTASPLPSADRAYMMHMAVVFGVLAAVGLVFSCGGYLSIDKFFYSLPIISRSTRWFSLFGSVFTSSLFVLAGIGFDVVTTSRPQGRRRLFIAAPLALALVFGLLILLFRNNAAEVLETFRTTYWRYIHSRIFMSEGFAPSAFPAVPVVTKFALFLIGGSFLILLVIFARLRPAAAFVLLSCCLLADKLVYASTRTTSNPSPIDVYTQTPPVVEVIKKFEPENSLYRIFVPPVLTHAGLLGGVRPDEYIMIRNFLGGSTGMPYHIATNNSFMSFREGGSQYVFQPWLESLNGDLRDRMLGLWNVKYVTDVSFDEHRRLKTGMHENKYVQPRAWLSYSKFPMNTLRDCLRQSQSPDFHARNTVLLVAPEILDKKLEGAPGTDDVESIKYTNNTVTITATSSRDGWLYISDTYENSWQARVDGTPATVYRANLNGRAIAFPKGRHTAVFKYSPRAFWIGLWIGAATWLALAICLFRIQFPRREQRA